MFGSRNFLFAKTAGVSVIGGKLFMWGKNNFGNLGLGDQYINRSSPVQVGALTDWAYVATTNSTLCVKTDSTLWSWGLNSDGTLGQNNTINRSSPVQVGALTNWKTPSLGNGAAFCLKTDGTIWSWGIGTSGGLGQGNTTNYSSPKQIGSSTNWTALVASGTNYSVLAVENGKLFAWGNNNKGQLGLGNTANCSSPVQVGALTDWATPDCSGVTHSLCVKTDGTLWAWGTGAYFGALGQNNLISHSSPVQVGALTNWAIPAASAYVSLCSKTDGTLWAWGYNGGGQLGQNNTIARSSPVQVGALTNWDKPSCKLGGVLCLKTDGTLWSWGLNNYGKLGQGNTTNISSPTQVGSLTTWVNKPTMFQNAGCVQT